MPAKKQPRKKQPRKKPHHQLDVQRPKGADRRVDRGHTKGGQFEPFTATDQERISVCLARSIGFSEEQTALFIRWPRGITVETLKKHFPSELQMGKEFIDARMTGSLISLASQKDDLKAALGAIKYWMANKMDWRAENALMLRKAGADEPDQDVSEVTFVIGTPMGKTEPKQEPTQPKGA